MEKPVKGLLTNQKILEIIRAALSMDPSEAARQRYFQEQTSVLRCILGDRIYNKHRLLIEAKEPHELQSLQKMLLEGRDQTATFQWFFEGGPLPPKPIRLISLPDWNIPLPKESFK